MSAEAAIRNGTSGYSSHIWLPSPFFVIATQNPFYQSGTYPLPESQLDRFFMRISLGFPPQEAERKLILGQNNRDYDRLPIRINAEQLIAIQNKISTVTLSTPVVDYILALVWATRNNSQFANALSPRAIREMLEEQVRPRIAAERVLA